MLSPGMNAEEREDQLIAETLGALDVLQLILWVNEDTARAGDTAISPALFLEEK